MRRYEVITIIDPELSKEQRVPVFEKLKSLIDQHDGFFVGIDEWGDRKLAYKIKKRSRGYYIRLDFCGTGDLVDEIERFFRIDDSILKYMTVLFDKNADIEKIKEQIAEAEAEAGRVEVSEDKSSVDDEDKTDEPEPENDHQDKPEISESQSVESETAQPEISEEEK